MFTDFSTLKLVILKQPSTYFYLMEHKREEESRGGNLKHDYIKKSLNSYGMLALVPKSIL